MSTDKLSAECTCEQQGNLMKLNDACAIHGINAPPRESYAYHPDDTDEISKAFFRGMEHGRSDASALRESRDDWSEKHAQVSESYAACMAELAAVTKQRDTALAQLEEAEKGKLEYQKRLHAAQFGLKESREQEDALRSTLSQREKELEEANKETVICDEAAKQLHAERDEQITKVKLLVNSASKAEAERDALVAKMTELTRLYSEAVAGETEMEELERLRADLR